MGAKRRLNGTSKVKRRMDGQTDGQTDGHFDLQTDIVVILGMLITTKFLR